jgi:hypothetical protein
MKQFVPMPAFVSTSKLKHSLLFTNSLFYLLLIIPSDALAGLCGGDAVEAVHRQEAVELSSQPYNSGSNCSSAVGPCFEGTPTYNELVIGCNRNRDVKPLAFGPFKDLPLVHRGAGKILDKRSASERRFAQDLPPRFVVGQYQYRGKWPKWYGYMLHREAGKWIVTSVLDFKFPKAEGKMLHISPYLAARLSRTQGGPVLDNDSATCQTASTGKSDPGRLLIGKSNTYRACRVRRNTRFFLSVPGSYLPASLDTTQSRPVTEWAMLYWREVLQQLWSRNGFELRIELADLVGRTGEIDNEDLTLFKKNDAVYVVEMHHNEKRWNNMFRPVKLAGAKLYKAIYAGLDEDGISHEFGHSLGLGDDYADSDDPPVKKPSEPGRNQFEYVMCDASGSGGDEGQDIKSVYLWLITQRYSIGKDIGHCKDDDACPSGQYCRKKPLGVNRCTPAKSVGENCTADKQCAGNAVCKPKPFGKCIVESAVPLGGACTTNAQCATGKCESKICVCARDSDCAGTLRCATWATKANECVRPCSSDSQCPGNLKCKKPIGTSFKRCK